MVVLDEQKFRLGAFGCESLARTAAYHTKDLKADESKDVQEDNDVQTQRFITRLCAVSPSFAHGVRQIFPRSIKHGAKLEFTDYYAEITCQKFSVKFIDSKDLVFFLEVIRPYFNLILYSGTHFWRKYLIDIANALIGNNEENGYNCFNSETLLKFDKLGNDSAYGTLIEYLAAKVSRIEVEDEFVTQLREEENSFDFLKIKSQSRADMYYTKSYFDVTAKEYDLRNVCSLSNIIMFTFEDFEIKPKPYIENITMSLLENESLEKILEGSEYLHRLAPNLRKLTFIYGRGLVIGNPDNASQAAYALQKALNDKYKSMLADVFSFVELELKIELSLYLNEAVVKENINWFTQIKEEFPDIKHVTTEHDTPAFQVTIYGNKPQDLIIARVHVYEREYNESDTNNWPHAAPGQIN